MGIFLVVLVVLALIAIIWGRDAAQSLIGCSFWLIEVVIACLGLYWVYISSHTFFWWIVVLAFVPYPLYLLLVSFKDSIFNACYRQEKQQKNNNIKQQIMILDNALRVKDAMLCHSICSTMVSAGTIDEAFPRLEVAISDIDEEVRRCAIIGFGLKAVHSSRFIGRATELLSRVLNDKAEATNLRKNAASAIGQLGSYEGLGSLLNNISDHDRNVRRGIYNGLWIFSTHGSFMLTASVPLLIAGLKDSDADVRLYSAKALGEVRNLQSLLHLQRVQLDSAERADVRQAAVEAVAKIRRL